MGQTWTIALYGATSGLGRQVHAALESSDVMAQDAEITLVPVAAGPATGERVTWRGEEIAILGPADVTVSDVDAAFIALPEVMAGPEIDRLRHAGTLVIDCSGAGSTAERALPVVWGREEALAAHPGGIALPGPPAATVAPILDTLTQLVGAPRAVELVELASASDLGDEGVASLSRQVIATLGHQIVDAAPFHNVLAFSALDLPDQDVLRADRVRRELRGLTGLADLAVGASTVLIPAFAGVVTCVSVRLGQAPEEAAATLHALVEALTAHPEIDMRPEGLALRDAIEGDLVLVGAPRLTGDTIRLTAMSDAPWRIGLRAVALLDRLILEELW